MESRDFPSLNRSEFKRPAGWGAEFLSLKRSRNENTSQPVMPRPRTGISLTRLAFSLLSFMVFGLKGHSENYHKFFMQSRIATWSPAGKMGRRSVCRPKPVWLMRMGMQSTGYGCESFLGKKWNIRRWSCRLSCGGVLRCFLSGSLAVGVVERR